MNPRLRPLAHESFGAGDPLILLHGLSGSGRWWDRNLAGLAQSNRVLTVDLPGFGSSRRSGPFALDTAVGQLIAWMDATGIERAAIAGHSLGGLVAVTLAATAPERVERLILVDAALLAFDPGLRNRARGVARSIRHLTPEIVPRMVGDALRSGPLAFAEATRELLLTGIPAALERIAVPTLVIWGELDTIVPLAVGEAIAARIPNARLVVMPGAAHNPMWEQPEAFNRLVLDFLHEPPTAVEDRASHSGDDPGDAGR